MKALRVEKYGPPSVLSVREVDTPEVEPGHALVEVRAAAVNPSDVKNVSGVFKATLPRVPGRDYAGVVVAATDGWKGKQVWGSGAGLGVTRDGSHAQYLLVAFDSISEKPSHLSMEEASTVGIAYLAAWMALVDSAALQAGETALVTGALGAVGRAAIQIAHWKKARVIGTDLVDAPSEADVLVNPKNKDLAVEVRALTGGKGVDVVVDAVGGPMFERCLKSLRDGGRYAVLASTGNDGRVEFNLRDFYHHRHRLMGVDTIGLTGPEIARIMDQLRAGFDDGQLRPSPVRTWPLEQGIGAYEAVARGEHSAKQILLPWP